MDMFLIFILSQNVKIMVMNTTMDFYGLIDLLWQPPATTSAAHLEMMASLINFNKPSINNIFPKLQQPLTASPCADLLHKYRSKRKRADDFTLKTSVQNM